MESLSNFIIHTDHVYDRAKNPHRVQHFLRALNEKLLKNKKSEDEQLGLSKAEKKKAGKKPETHKLGKGGKLESRAVNSLQALTVFGLTEHHLGKDSIEILGVIRSFVNCCGYRSYVLCIFRNP